jgi:hypothetical protein
MFGDCGRVSVMDGVVTVLAWFRAPGPILKTIVLFNCGRLVLVSFLSPTYTHRSYPNGKAQDQENEPNYEESGLSTRHSQQSSLQMFLIFRPDQKLVAFLVGRDLLSIVVQIH